MTKPGGGLHPPVREADMTRGFHLALALCLGFAAIPLVPATPQAPPATFAETAILTTLDAYFAAVNGKDTKRFLDFFVPDDDLTVLEDKDLRWCRRDFAAFVDGFFKDVSEIHATWERRTVHPLAPGVAAVTGTFRVEGKDAKGAPMAFRNAFTFVLVNRSGRWLVKHVHESSLDP